MDWSKKLQTGSYSVRAESLGLVTTKNEGAFSAVNEMSKHPLSLEQKREQVRKANPDGVRYSDPKKR